MKFTKYILTHHVFTTAHLLENADSKKSSTQQLKMALASGVVERVRRGLYVSNSPVFESKMPDPYEVVVALDVDAVLSYHSALEALGVAHNVGFTCHFRSDVVRSSFSYDGVTYFPHDDKKASLTQKIRGRAFGSILCTTREQTFFDCLKHPEWSGGIEESVRSLSAFSYLDTVVLAKLALADSASMAARVGWLLDAKSTAWEVPERVLNDLHEASQGVKSKFDKRSIVAGGWSGKWNIVLPDTEKEMATWIS